MGRKFKLGKPEIEEELKKKEKEAKRARDIQRLMAVRMAMSGEFTLEQIGKAVGRARSRIAEWMKVVRESGLEAMLAKHQGRGKKPRISTKAHKELRTGLRRGRWKTIKEAGQWLEQRHRIKMGIGGVRYWVKKSVGGPASAAQDPRP